MAIALGGGPRGGRGRGGGGGGGRGGGMKFASNIAAFDTEVDAHESGINAVAAWQENNTLFTAGADGKLKMFDVTNGSSTEQPEGAAVTALCMHVSWLFVGYVGQPQPGVDVGFVKAYNFASKPPEQFNFSMSQAFPAAHATRTTSICVAGDMVCTAGEDGAVRAWKLADGAWGLVGSFGGSVAHNGPVRRVASFNGHIYTGAASGEVKVWSMAGVQESQLQAHTDAIVDIVGWAGADKVALFTCSADKTVKVWDLQQNNGVPPPSAQPGFTYPPPGKFAHPKTFSCIATHTLANGSSVLVCGYVDGSIQLLNLPDFMEHGFLSGHTRSQPITSLVVMSAQNLLFAGSLSGKLSCFKFLPAA